MVSHRKAHILSHDKSAHTLSGLAADSAVCCVGYHSSEKRILLFILGKIQLAGAYHSGKDVSAVVILRAFKVIAVEVGTAESFLEFIEGDSVILKGIVFIDD